MSRIVEIIFVALLLFLCVACGGDSGENGEDASDGFFYDPGVVVVWDNPPEIQMDFSAAPLIVDTGATVEFTVDASVTGLEITASMIDFDGDGFWDETHDHGSNSISTSFAHIYESAGSYSASAAVEAGVGPLQVGAGRTVQITVTDPGSSN